MKHAFTHEGAVSGDRSVHIDTFSPALTLGEYEIEEVSVGRAARIFEKSKRYPFKVVAVSDVSADTRPIDSSIADWNPPRKIPGYDVEEIEPQDLAIWISEEGSDKQERSGD